jgi:hypothetical protein
MATNQGGIMTSARLISTGFGAVFALGVLSLASDSGAVWTTVHGAACQPNGGTTVAQVDYKSIYNPSTTSTAGVVCPVTFVSPEATPAQLVVFVDDQSTTSGVQCTARKLDTSGNVVWASTQTTTAASTGVQILAFNFSAASNPQISLDCGLPPRTGNSSRILFFAKS